MCKIPDLYPHYVGFTHFENPHEQVKKQDHKKAVYGDNMQSIAVHISIGRGLCVCCRNKWLWPLSPQQSMSKGRHRTGNSVEENDQTSPVNTQTSKTVRHTVLDEQIMNKLNSLKYWAIQH